MTVLIVILSLILLIVVIVNFPVQAHIRFYDGKPDIQVTFLWIQLYPTKPKKEKKPKKKSVKDELSGDPSADTSETAAQTTSEENPQEKASEAAEEKKQKASKMPEAEKEPLIDRISAKLDELNEKKNAVMLLLELAGKPLKKFFGKIRIDDIIIDFDAANEDAYEAAMLYGKLCTAVYNLLSAVRCYISISVISVTIDCLYNTPKEKCRYEGEMKIRLRPASVLNLVGGLVFRFLFNFKKYRPVLILAGK